MPAAETARWDQGHWMPMWCRLSCCGEAVQAETHRDIPPQSGTSSSGGVKENVHLGQTEVKIILT